MQEAAEATRSVCPVCLRPLAAVRRREGEKVYLEKTCPAHGAFRAIIWHGAVSYDGWRGDTPLLGKNEGLHCPQGCGICPEHLQGSCCVLLEVTRRCNLKCRFCFADGAMPEPGLDELKRSAESILSHGRPLIQLTGGEPTLRDDLPELIRHIKAAGGRYVQLNSNGLRLAEDESYVKALAAAGLSFVFMQFDGVSDDIYERLRGRPLLAMKRRAIENCNRHNLGVTLVPTVVRGVNDGQIGDIVRYAATLSPAVRGVHFQPVSYFGRYPEIPEENERYTLDELVFALGEQAGIGERALFPSRCDHPMCGLHASFVISEEGTLMTTPARRQPDTCTRTTARQNREYIGTRWERPEEPVKCCCGSDSEIEDIDEFLSRAKSCCFTITAMAFQDAMNFDIERLRRCSLHVYDGGALKPFCARYLTAVKGDGKCPTAKK